MGAGRALAELAERHSSELVSLPSLPEPRSPALYSLDDDEENGDQEGASLLPDVTAGLGGSEKATDGKHRQPPGSTQEPDSDDDDSHSGSEGQTRWQTGGRECVR